MGRWSRDELERAFADYQTVAARSATTGDWNHWTDLFTEDATYVEHLFGEFAGREAIRAWITRTMGEFPGNTMPEFPIEWYVIDEERGWVLCQIWNRMADPGDGSVHQAYNFTLLKYAGSGRWSYEEDVYNPSRFADMVSGWQDRKASLEGSPSD
jgi:hypothetical protein